MALRWLAAALALATTSAVDRSKFRTCQDTRFCRQHRRPPVPPPAYRVDVPSVRLVDGVLRMELSDGAQPPLVVTVAPHAAGVVRTRIVERDVTRWEADDVLLQAAFELDGRAALSTSHEGASLKLSSGHVVDVTYAPFAISLKPPNSKDPTVVLNSRQLLHFERGSSQTGTAEEVESKCEKDFAWNGQECLKIAGYWEDGLARFEDGSKEIKEYLKKTSEDGLEETFSGHTDRPKNGPTSVGIDVSFPGSKAAFGLAEHASSFALKPTTGTAYSEPYRFYNLDVFEYDLDVPMALYGAIPLAWAVDPSRRSHHAAGVFYNNPSETFVDVSDDWSLRFVSESGVLELFLFAPSTPSEGFAQYSSLTGAQELPPMFALGYHQCRWNYKDEADVKQVHGRFEEEDIPYDVLWLDIEHTDGKRYFTWDSNLFPDPVQMQEDLWHDGRRMVTIVDPHIKRDGGYKVHADAVAKGLYLKDGDADFDGWCWPGSSSYPDFTNPKVRQWWAERFSLENYAGSTSSLYIWNDMNEMSVFNGPEVTMHKSVTNLEGIEHREWHNLYGMYVQRATAEGLMLRDANKRPFVLSRSFYAGSQRWGAVWTGDNAARWDHLQQAAPMLLSMSVCGLVFVGADAGGFFGDPDAELMARWVQAAAYTPFFRGHAHHDAKRREPWSFGEPTTAYIRRAIADRYALLPYWYSVFAESRFSGQPVMRPLWAEFPADANALLLDDQWMVGSALLVKPVTAQGASHVDAYLPSGRWYEVRFQRRTPSTRYLVALT